MDGRRRRGGSPDVSHGYLPVILHTIHGYYKEALDALPLDDKPKLAPRLLAAGVCFGFADPTTNIVANTLRFVPNSNGDPETDGGKKRKREMLTKTEEAAISKEEVLSAIVAGDIPSRPEARTIAERSLEGLITFLTSYFCYLPHWDALRYLCLAKADLLLAVRLIEIDRCYRNKDEFCISSYVVKSALKYAALSARQPNVDDFHTSSF